MSDKYQVKSSSKDIEEITCYSPEMMYAEIYYDINGELVTSEDLARLHPLIEYVYDEQQDVECKTDQYIEISHNEQNNDSDNVQDSFLTECSEGDMEIIQPMMPVFSTSILEDDDQNESETIILQIEEDEEEIKEKKEPIPDALRASSLQPLLCPGRTTSLLTIFSCEICLLSYGCLNCLRSHYETMHLDNTSIARYKCKYSRNTSKDLFCPVCDLSFDNSSDNMDHYVTHAVECDICGSGFDRRQYLTEHRRKVHNKGDFDISYECIICGVNHQYSHGLSKHYQKSHYLILCIECKQRFLSLDELQEHEKSHKLRMDVLPFACSKCDKAFPKISDIAIHIKQDHYHLKRKQQFETVYFINQVEINKKTGSKKKNFRVRK